MSRTDLIADSFTIIRNAIQVKREFALLPWANIIVKICELLEKEKYIENFKEVDLGKFKMIKVYLKYEGKNSAIRELKRVSKPGRKVYVKKEEVRPVLKGYGVAMISTPLGLLTDAEAREKKVGGEIIGMVW